MTVCPDIRFENHEVNMHVLPKVFVKSVSISTIDQLLFKQLLYALHQPLPKIYAVTPKMYEINYVQYKKL